MLYYYNVNRYSIVAINTIDGYFLQNCILYVIVYAFIKFQIGIIHTSNTEGFS